MKKIIIKSLLYCFILTNITIGGLYFTTTQNAYASNNIDNNKNNINQQKIKIDIIDEFNKITKSNKNLYNQFVTIKQFIQTYKSLITEKQMDFLLHREFEIAQKIFLKYKNNKDEYITQPLKICDHILKQIQSDHTMYTKVLLLKVNIYNKQHNVNNLPTIIKLNYEIINDTKIAQYHKIKAYYNIILSYNYFIKMNIDYNKYFEKIIDVYNDFNTKYGHIDSQTVLDIHKLINNLFITDINKNIYLSNFYEQKGNKKASIKYFQNILNNDHLENLKNKDMVCKDIVKNVNNYTY